jgi:hypothetical protein
MNLITYIKTNKPSYLKKGHFTKAYLYNKSNEVILESRCNVKECMALGWFPESSLFPAITFSDLESNKDGFKVYKMPLYTTNSRSVKSIICKEDYENIYLPLRKICFVIDYKDFKDQLFKVGVSDGVREIILEAYEACMNYGSDVGWEISPRNVAATSEGKLVLLDCFFIKSQLRWNH